MYIVSDKVSSLLTKAGIIESGKEIKKSFVDEVVFAELIKSGLVVEDKKIIEVKPEKVETIEEKKEEKLFDEKKKDKI